MVIFLYNLCIFVLIQHFGDPFLNLVITKSSYNELCYKEVAVFLVFLLSLHKKYMSGTSNEYTQHTFLWRNKKNISTVCFKKKQKKHLFWSC